MAYPAGVLHSPRMLFTLKFTHASSGTEYAAIGDPTIISRRRRHIERSAFRTKRYHCTYTYPDDSVQLGHGHLFGSVDRRGDLLLMLLREKRQDLRDDGVQPFRDLRLKIKQTFFLNIREQKLQLYTRIYY